MRLIGQALLSLGVATWVLASGCGGKTVGNDDGGPGGSSGNGGSGGAGGTSGAGGSAGTGFEDCGCPIDAKAIDCPTSPPTIGSACLLSNLYCEYGSAPNPFCNQIFQCDPAGEWALLSNTGVCPPPGPLCPASYADASHDHGKCPTDGQTCAYPEGVCICTTDPGGLPTTDGPLWSCEPPGSGCSPERPTLGTPCSSSSTVCDYGGCNGGLDEQCVDGFWAIAMTACPA